MITTSMHLILKIQTICCSLITFDEMYFGGISSTFFTIIFVFVYF